MPMQYRLKVRYFNKLLIKIFNNSYFLYLQQRGFNLLGIDEWPHLTEKLSLISALNLIDRMDKPLQLLNQVRVYAM